MEADKEGNEALEAEGGGTTATCPTSFAAINRCGLVGRLRRLLRTGRDAGEGYTAIERCVGDCTVLGFECCWEAMYSTDVPSDYYYGHGHGLCSWACFSEVFLNLGNVIVRYPWNDYYGNRYPFFLQLFLTYVRFYTKEVILSESLTSMASALIRFAEKRLFSIISIVNILYYIPTGET